MASPPFLERLGIRYLANLSKKAGPVDVGDGVHFLNPNERAALRAIERAAIVRAVVAGALSAVVSAGAEIAAQPLLGADPALAHWHDNVRFWAIVGGFTALASIIEVLYLYWDSLRAVHELARAAGLDLFPEGDEERAVAAAMARSALELPNPADRLYGVDPRRETSRFRLVFVSIFYKLKVSVTNFIVKTLLRRALGRAIARTWLPLVAIPITAAWNGVICWLVVREARIRAMGPSAAHEMAGVAFDGAPDMSPDAREIAVRAVASSIVRTEDLHPNLVAVLSEVKRRAGDPEIEDVDDPRRFLARLGELASGVELQAVLRILSIAAVIDGRMTGAERTLLAEAHVVAGLEPDLHGTESLRRAFVNGDPLPPAVLAAIAAPPPDRSAVAA